MGEEWPPLHAVRPYVEVSLPEGAEAVYSAAAAARTSAGGCRVGLTRDPEDSDLTVRDRWPARKPTEVLQGGDGFGCGFALNNLLCKYNWWG